METQKPASNRQSRIMKSAYWISVAFTCLALLFSASLTFWQAFVTLAFSMTTLLLATFINHRERQKTFKDFNSRSYRWRQKWAHSQSWPCEAIDAYIHLSAEKYWAYEQGLVSAEVWVTWRREMDFYFSKDAFVEHWHLNGSDSIYGFHPSVVSVEFPRDLDGVIARKIARQERNAS